jgi:sporulation protein YlmC with PRC-barrel domain
METQGTEDRPIPVDAEVRCTDGACGRSTYVVINPVTEQVTHVVVKGAAPPQTEYLVPVDYVASATADQIQLKCTRDELEHLDPFVQTEYIEEKMPTYVTEGGSASFYYLPYAEPEQTVRVQVEHQQIPPGELAVRRGTRVEATDGSVGRVDEFLVNPNTGNITHLVMREGHLWGKKDVSIPLSAIRETRDDAVLLNLDKQQIESLPIIPIHRRGSGSA